MTTLFLLVALSSAYWAAADITCPKGGCGNITIYLGPRWGSKVITYTYRPKVTTPRTPEGTGKYRFLSNSRYYGDLNEYRPSTPRGTVPRFRPITDENRIKDYNDGDNEVGASGSWYSGDRVALQTSTTPGGLRRGQEITLDMNELVYNGVINLTETGLTGDELKSALSQVRLSPDSENSVLNKLTHLYLGHNQISQLPSFVFPVQLEYSLQELRLDNNPITSMTAGTRFEISRLANLKVLSLANTGLRYLENLYTHSLEVLDLSHNRLLNVPLSLAHLQNLRELYLDNNRINTLYETPFSNLRELRVLSLSGNYISYIWDAPFLNLNFLYELKLDHNSIERLDDVSVHPITKVYLGSNLMRCGCPLLDSLRRSWIDIVDKDNLTCFLGSRDDVRLVSSLHQYSMFDCPHHWDWLRPSQDQLEGAVLWVHRHSGALLAMALCAVIASLMMVVALRRCRSAAKAKPVPKEIPYNVLDDNLLP